MDISPFPKRTERLSKMSNQQTRKTPNTQIELNNGREKRLRQTHLFGFQCQCIKGSCILYFYFVFVFFLFVEVDGFIAFLPPSECHLHGNACSKISKMYIFVSFICTVFRFWKCASCWQSYPSFDSSNSANDDIFVWRQVTIYIRIDIQRGHMGGCMYALMHRTHFPFWL